MEAFLKRKIGMKIKVRECERSGNIMVIRLENRKIKKEVMRCKSKLKGENIFIEHEMGG